MAPAEEPVVARVLLDGLGDIAGVLFRILDAVVQ
ncbi:MAG: hypothetical protein ACJAZ9_000166 [Neolewinella sp.]|jgi:hypothetical protein